MPLLEMKLLKTEFALKARFRALFTLFLIVSGGLSLPQMPQRIRHKSHIDVQRQSMSQFENLAKNKLDLKDIPTENALSEHQPPSASMNRKPSGHKNIEHLRRRDAQDHDVYGYPAKSGVRRVKTKRHAAENIPDDVLQDPFSNSRRQESDSNIQDLDAYHIPKQQEPSFVDTNHLTDDGTIQGDAPSDRFSIDSILNDVPLGKESSDSNVIDYYFVDDALLREGQHHLRHSSVRHGVIINLTGLIPTADSEYDDRASVEGQNNQDEVLAYRAFEISPSSGVESVRLSPLISADSDDPHLNDEPSAGGGGGYADSATDRKHAGHHQSSDSRTSTWLNKQEEDDTPDATTTGENRNLSRKRRQKSLPDPSDVDRQRRHFARRRRRKRKRRHRNGARVTSSSVPSPHDSGATRRSGDERHSRTEVAEAVLPPVVLGGQERFLLKSNSPAYVITSASEVKKDWCKTVPFKQKIVHKNCKPRFIMNNFCYGQCNSFFIPHVGRTGSGAAFQSCALCKPYKYKWTTVTLSCPRQEQQRVDKQVLIIESCRCKSETLQ